ncbi:flagellar motor switch protein FliN [Actinophytocola xanthii]|uniref:Flagellar motor switch protein FliN n=1 Tax=Actinophytocola xanthii TaxID=1912961 RepID=A0A1Q8BXS3_9PSEU|nr:flagellar motor switch protein FliN [Actinophytocola xanthii]OLF06904.1 flagellar motor switch protein FliN [Actinophytocola xanthii]
MTDTLLTTLRAAAEAAMTVLPAGENLTVGEAASDAAVAGTPGAAVYAQLNGDVNGGLAVLVAQELVDALAASPFGQLDLASAIAPAIDAAAGVLGATAAPGRELPVQEALSMLAGTGQPTFLPLAADGAPHATIALSVVVPAPAEPAKQASAPTRPAVSGLDLLHGVEMEVTVELGRTRMTVRDLLSLRPGSVVELDRVAGSPADVLVNGRLIARGEVVVVDENFGIRITEIVTAERDAEAA